MGKVLITRSLERARPLVDALAARGVSAAALPMTHATTLQTPPPVNGLTGVSALAFTSARAVDPAAEAFASRGWVLSDVVPIVAVGNATADAARERFGRVDLVGDAGTGAALAQQMREAGVDGPVLWPRAERVAGGFAETLADAGIDVIGWPIYRTDVRPVEQLRPALDAQHPWDVAFFAAPSAVRGFRAAWGSDWSFPCAAIGPTTAEALKSAGATKVATCGRPDTAAMVETIMALLATLSGTTTNTTHTESSP